MTLPAFAEPDELQQLLSELLPGASFDTDRAAFLLERASDSVRDDVGQRIDFTADDVCELTGNGERVLVLPELPVTAVGAVTVDGTAVTDWTWRRSGVLRRWAGWPFDSAVAVTYSHGYQVIPAVAHDVTITAAARAYLNPGQLLSENAGAAQVGYGSALGRSVLGLTDDEKRRLDPLRP